MIFLKSLPFFLFPFFISFFSTPFVRKIAQAKNLLDYPDSSRKIHTQPTPLLGGACLGGSFLLSAFLLFLWTKDITILGLSLGGLLILFTGLMDDLKGLSAEARLLIQILATLILIFTGIVLSFLPHNLWGRLGEWLLTFLWIIGITNALNFLDGMNGLATGISIVSMGAFVFLCFVSNQILLAMLGVSFLGACLGFLPYNLSGKIFLGDMGSTFLGFSLASFAIMGTWAKDNIVALSIPILILGVPIFDMCFTTVMRIKTHKIKNLKEWIEFTGRDHFHHYLLELGLTQIRAVIFIYFISASLGISAIILWSTTRLDAILLLLQSSIIFVLIAILMIVGRQKRKVSKIKNV